MGQEMSHEVLDDSVPARTLKDRTARSAAEFLKSGGAKRVVVLTGAGISTSAGIPDFRSPDTGLYSNLARLDLPYPEAVFDISFFRSSPQPFYTLAQELYPGKYRPTVAHAFIALLARKGLLHLLFTQNIDCLEREAGVPGDKIVEAHGSFATQRCIECRAEYPEESMKEFVARAEVPHCPECDGLVKPDIVFFGEALPERFHSNTHVASEADLMIIIGTSLSVHPFAALPELAEEGKPRLLLNMEKVGSLGSRPDDVLLLGDSDGGVRKLADESGWRDELEELYRAVGGEPAKEKPLTAQARHDTLEEEVDLLTSEVDQALKISGAHKDWLEKHLAEKPGVHAEPKPSEAPDDAEAHPKRADSEKPAPETLDSKPSAEPSAEQFLHYPTKEEKASELDPETTSPQTAASALEDVENKSTPSSVAATIDSSDVPVVKPADSDGSPSKPKSTSSDPKDFEG